MISVSKAAIVAAVQRNIGAISAVAHPTSGQAAASSGLAGHQPLGSGRSLTQDGRLSTGVEARRQQGVATEP
jgi:hypothetical protein